MHSNNALVKETLPSMIILGGDDSIGREKVKEQIFQKLYAKHGSLIEDHYDSSRESLDDYLTRLMTPNLFGEITLFHIKHLQKLPKKDLESIAEVLTYPFDHIYLLLEYDEDKKGALSKALNLKKIEKEDFLLHIALLKPKPYQLAEWLITQVERLFGRSIVPQAAEQLVSFTGSDLDRIYTELQKLDIYLEKNERITLEAIETVSGVSHVVKPDDLNKAVGFRRLEEALTTVDALFLGNGFSPIMLVSMLYRHFWNLYKIRSFAESNKNAANRYFKTSYKEKNLVAGDIGIGAGIITEKTRNRTYPAIVLPGIIDQAVKYSSGDIMHILSLLASYDRGLKSGTVPHTSQALRELCYTIIRMGQLERV